jgi:3-hydroxyisobutyrate dehydrogenase
MGLAMRCARTAGIQLPLGKAAEEIYERVIDDDPGNARKDFSVVYKYLERLATAAPSATDV